MAISKINPKKSKIKNEESESHNPTLTNLCISKIVLCVVIKNHNG